jgi:predicted XRE-type DNA-binding protein
MIEQHPKIGIPGVDHEITEVDGILVGGGDNFLADRGHKNPAEMRAKILLADNIRLLIEARGWHQADAALVVDVAQTDISRIVRGLVRGYSVWKLAKILNDLGAATEILVHLPSGQTEAIAIA